MVLYGNKCTDIQHDKGSSDITDKIQSDKQWIITDKSHIHSHKTNKIALVMLSCFIVYLSTGKYFLKT